jgi:hypothetical protein
MRLVKSVPSTFIVWRLHPVLHSVAVEELLLMQLVPTMLLSTLTFFQKLMVGIDVVDLLRLVALETPLRLG